jgi:hypothetical protein
MTYGLRRNHILPARPAPRCCGLFRQSRAVRLHIASTVTVKVVKAGLEISCWEWNMGGLGDRQFVHTGWFESLGYYV